MGWAARPGAKVTDRSGVTYVLRTSLGQGGQGEVFETTAEGAAVKVSNDGGSARAEQIEQQIRTVARMPIADLRVAQPRHTLRPPATGYTMTHVTGTIPASLLTTPKWDGLERWYHETGGLRKRFGVIRALSGLIGALHSRGLVYGDLNASNAMISEARQRSAVYLIDLDNLAYCSDPRRRIMTPPFAAPEQWDEGVSQETDRFSLGVISYQALIGINPFYGPVLDDLSPDDLSSPFAGLGAWIDDPDDRSNAWSVGMDRSRVISPRLHAWFREMFTAGRLQPRARPAVARLGAAALAAEHALVACRNCAGEDLVSSTHCLMCGTPLAWSGFRVLEELPDGERRKPRSPPVLVTDGGPTTFTGEALGLAGTVGRAMTVWRQGDRWQVRCETDELWLDGILVVPAEMPGTGVARLHRRRRLPLLLVSAGSA
jgi:eukaryotic-like serine/threonine-protein kinase